MSEVRKLSAKLGHFELAPHQTGALVNYGMDADYMPLERCSSVDMRVYFSAPCGRRVEIPDWQDAGTYDRWTVMAHAACEREANAYHADPTAYVIDLLDDAADAADYSSDVEREEMVDAAEYLPAIAQDWAALQDERAADKARIAELEQTLAMVSAGAAE